MKEKHIIFQLAAMVFFLTMFFTSNNIFGFIWNFSFTLVAATFCLVSIRDEIVNSYRRGHLDGYNAKIREDGDRK